VFRDELGNLLYGDPEAKRMQEQTFLLSEFLQQRGYKPPHIQRRALVHGHCHQKSLLNFEQEEDLLRGAGLDCEIPDSGCCGMAGSFGYEADHYDVGLACGERALLPAVRRSSDDQLIVTNGFSCREMIRQETGRRALHVAQVLRMGIGAPRPTAGKRRSRPVAAIAAGFAAALTAWALFRR
jgi:Fe-S oxidoreductase